MKNISSLKYVDVLWFVFKNIIPGAITPYFEEFGGVTQPLTFRQRKK